MANSGTEPHLLVAGGLLAERYLLVEVVPGPGPAVLWRAVDEVLARSVAVKALSTQPEGGSAGAEPFLAAAVRTGVLVHPGLARVYDATIQPRPGGGPGVALVISEWVDGQSLDSLLATRTVEATEAVDLVRQAADALSAAHDHDLVHGRLHPGNVLVTADGRIKLTDLAVATAVHAGSAAASGEHASGEHGTGAYVTGEHGLAWRTAAVPTGATPADVRRDTLDLAAVLYALLTARWPVTATDLPAGRLAAAPVAGGRVLRPRQVTAAVPRPLDAVVARALDPLAEGTELGTPAAFAAAAEKAVGKAPDRHAVPLRRPAAADAVTRPSSRVRRLVPWLLVLGLLAGIGTAGWLLGLAVGGLPRRDGAVDAIVSTTTAPSPGAPRGVAPIDLSRLPLSDFDPPPGDGRENPDSVRNAVDGDPGTSWQTSTYRTAGFGNLKKGVGLLVDLGISRTLSQVQVGFTSPGASVELRVADTVVPTTADSFTTVAAQRASGAVATLRPAAGARGRYWLVWLTALPQEGRGYRVGISELRFS